MDTSGETDVNEKNWKCNPLINSQIKSYIEERTALEAQLASVKVKAVSVFDPERVRLEEAINTINNRIRRKQTLACRNAVSHLEAKVQTTMKAYPNLFQLQTGAGSALGTPPNLSAADNDLRLRTLAHRALATELRSMFQQAYAKGNIEQVLQIDTVARGDCLIFREKGELSQPRYFIKMLGTIFEVTTNSGFPRLTVASEELPVVEEVLNDSMLFNPPETSSPNDTIECDLGPPPEGAGASATNAVVNNRPNTVDVEDVAMTTLPPPETKSDQRFLHFDWFADQNVKSENRSPRGQERLTTYSNRVLSVVPEEPEQESARNSQPPLQPTVNGNQANGHHPTSQLPYGGPPIVLQPLQQNRQPNYPTSSGISSNSWTPPNIHNRGAFNQGFPNNNNNNNANSNANFYNAQYNGGNSHHHQNFQHHNNYHRQSNQNGFGNQSPSSQQCPSQQSCNQQRTPWHLPKFDMPTFEGDLLSFRGWYDKFILLVENSTAPIPYKYTALRQALGEEPLRHISCYEDDTENYYDILASLRAKYGDDSILVRQQMDRLINYPQIPHNDYEKLNKFVNDVKGILFSLKKVNRGDPLSTLIHLERKLPPKLLTDWNEYHYHNCKDKPVDVLKHFVSFVEGKVHFRTGFTYNPPRANGNGNGNNKSNGHNRSRNAQSFNTAVNENSDYEEYSSTTSSAPSMEDFEEILNMSQSTFKSKSTPCLYCKKPGHYINKCFLFKNLKFKERVEKVKHMKLCIRCLQKGHKPEKCPYDLICPTCKNKHHALLHKPSSGDKPPKVSHKALNSQHLYTTHKSKNGQQPNKQRRSNRQ